MLKSIINIDNVFTRKIKNNNSKIEIANTKTELKNIINLPNDINEQDIQHIIEKEKNRLRSDEYVRRKMASTGRSETNIKKEVENIITHISKTTLVFDEDTDDFGGGVYVNDKKNPKAIIFPDKFWWTIGSVDHEIKHALSESALDISDGLMRLFYDKYRKYPKQNINRWYDNIHPFENMQKWANNRKEQQAITKRIMDYIEETQWVKRGSKLTIENINILKKDMNNFLNKKSSIYSDIFYIMRGFQKKFGDNYPYKLLELLNNAY